MTPEELAAAIRTVLEEASAEGSLALPAAEIPAPRVERPRNRDHGDWSTNVAMQLAKKAGTKPRDLAELLVALSQGLAGDQDGHPLHGARYGHRSDRHGRRDLWRWSLWYRGLWRWSL